MRIAKAEALHGMNEAARFLAGYYMETRVVNMSHNNVPYMYMKCAFSLVFTLTVSNIEHKF